MVDQPAGSRGFTFASFTTLGPRAGVELAARADAAGYRSFWTAEAAGPEAFALLGAAGEAGPGLDLATGIVPIQVRSPLLTAMAAGTLQQLHPERDILLGIGVSSPIITESWHGVSHGVRPIERVREHLDILRRLFDGEAVTVDSEHVSLRKSRLGLRLGEQKPKLILAALNPRMLALAGEAADGVLLNYLPADHVAWSVAQVRAGEEAAGRPAGSCRIYAYVHAAVCERTDKALTYARRDLFSYAVADGYAASFIRAGYGDEIAELRAARAAGDRDGAVAAISERMIDGINVIGDAATVNEAMTAYAAAGVDEPVLMPLPWGEDRRQVVEDTLEACAPSR